MSHESLKHVLGQMGIDDPTAIDDVLRELKNQKATTIQQVSGIISGFVKKYMERKHQQQQQPLQETKETEATTTTEDNTVPTLEPSYTIDLSPEQTTTTARKTLKPPSADTINCKVALSDDYKWIVENVIGDVVKTNNPIINQWIDYEKKTGECCYVKEDDKIVAFALLGKLDYDPFGDSDSSYSIHYIHTQPTRRRRGMARLLLQELVKWQLAPQQQHS